jgi:VIT1/CCC1 family predicted Fe2+/Mn2+ transporter/rubrerythrin
MSTEQQHEPIIENTVTPAIEQQVQQGQQTQQTRQAQQGQPAELDSTTRRELIAALQQNWQREIEGVRTYRDLAQKERDAARRAVLVKMADAEQRHAQKWERKLAELGAEPPKEQRSLGTRFKGWLRRQLGTEAALRQLEGEEDKDIARYEAQARSINDVEAQAMLREVRREEESHGRIIRDIISPIGPQGMLDVMLRRERWHKRGGGWLGDAIYGANDGLGAVFGIVSGVAGYTGGAASNLVLISGLAGMLASALSMGSGAFLATKSEREVYQAEINREKREIEEDPEEEKEELALFYQLKGFTEDESQLLANRLSEKPEQFLRTLAHEELGLSEDSFPNPVVAAVSATISTGLGAFIPIIPFFFLSGFTAIIAAAAISLVAHFAVGAAKTLVTGRSWFNSGMEMTIVGAVEAVITYLLGATFKAL